MCDTYSTVKTTTGTKTMPVAKAVGMVLAHDVTEIRKDEFKGRAFRKGHIVREEDVDHLQRLGKEHLFVLSLGPDEMHEDDAAHALAVSLVGDGVALGGEPREGKINLIAAKDGLFKVDRDALSRFNMLGEVMCATLHTNTVVRTGQLLGGTRAIPLVVKNDIVHEAVRIAAGARKNGTSGVLEVKEIRKAKVGVVITGNEVYYGRIKDAFAPIIKAKIETLGGEIAGIYYAPDDETFIEERLRELLKAGADLLITTGGMSVDPDDVTRFAIRNLGASDITYGSAALPGAMVLVGYLQESRVKRQESGRNKIQPLDSAEYSFDSGLLTDDGKPVPILGIPACGMYHKITVFDLIIPRVLAGEKIGRKELAELGHGGLCLNCRECRYPACPFGK